MSLELPLNSSLYLLILNCCLFFERWYTRNGTPTRNAGILMKSPLRKADPVTTGAQRELVTSRVASPRCYGVLKILRTSKILDESDSSVPSGSIPTGPSVSSAGMPTDTPAPSVLAYLQVPVWVAFTYEAIFRYCRTSKGVYGLRLGCIPKN